MPPKYLTEFYALMNHSREIRRLIVNDFLKGLDIKNYTKPLSELQQNLLNIEHKGNKYKLYFDAEHYILADLTYEISEIEKDILFCQSGFEAVDNWHLKKHLNFNAELDETIHFLNNQDITHFISDRDGTINNYCGRYQSSIQSAYNAIWLTLFAQRKTKSSTILTSAPIATPGILDVNVSPENNFILAGSKGRELIFEGKRYELEISAQQKDKLQELEQKIKNLTGKDQYKKFTLIGSGLQMKFGQITLARQDITDAIPKRESTNLLKVIQHLVSEVDPEGTFFRIEDTGKDIEIMLTVSDNRSTVKDFDKGDGLNFINKTLKLGLEHNNCLVCGDTHSDIPMVTKLLYRNDKVFSIFVTQNPVLIRDLKKKLDQNKLLIVSNPDVLVSALGKFSDTNKK